VRPYGGMIIAGCDFSCGIQFRSVALLAPLSLPPLPVVAFVSSLLTINWRKSMAERSMVTKDGDDTRVCPTPRYRTKMR
jgi:hypothetical protein